MSGGWESTGGAGGISANNDDMESLSVLYGGAALTLAEVAAEVALIAASGELLESAVLSPGSFAQVMRVIGELELGRTGLAASGLELGELSLHLRQAVLAYRFVDAAMSEVTIGAQNLGGFVVGAALPAVAIPAAGLVLGGEAACDLPGFLADLVDGRASLSSFPSRVLSTTAADANAFVLAHPGLLQDGIGGAAGLETGLQAWVPVPLRWTLPFQGVPRDYPQAVQNLAGFFRDGNPDRANVTTLTFGDNKGSVGENHSLREAYAVAAADLPGSDPSYAAWRDSARGFLNPANQTSTTDTYAITREAGS